MEMVSASSIVEVLFLAACLTLAGNSGWQAVTADRNRLWRTLCAFGWLALALSGVTDGIVGIGVCAVSLAAFALAASSRRTDNANVDTA
ncbi:hypothetical protein SAMN05216278_0846 [Halopelagius longus]|uniref:Uncharacterized protein n=1 Tax=Halopelagius longus TaxID=1236180 RepID=A0A1H0YU34_9EURY|nr:hypothetical protein SAMN05216278_0846 [Halopelagius longus]